jgi:uncharacterized protein (TIGR00369 family)
MTEMEQALRAGIGAQGFMNLVGAVIDEVGEGRLVMSLARRPEVLQQHGFFHGGVIAFLVDNAATGAAATMAGPAGRGVLTAEYKLNFVSPATGDSVVCEAQVLKPGRMLSVVEAKVWTVTGGTRKLCAAALATIASTDAVPVSATKGGA